MVTITMCQGHIYSERDDRSIIHYVCLYYDGFAYQLLSRISEKSITEWV